MDKGLACPKGVPRIAKGNIVAYEIFIQLLIHGNQDGRIILKLDLIRSFCDLFEVDESEYNILLGKLVLLVNLVNEYRAIKQVAEAKKRRVEEASAKAKAASKRR